MLISQLAILNFLRDPIWTFIGVVTGVILTIITIVVPIVLTIKQKSRKILSYTKSEVLLLTVEEEIAGRIKVLFDKQTVKKVTVIIVKIINNGNVPIVSGDYEEPIRLNFNSNSVILSSQIIEKSPRQLNINLEKHSNYLIIPPTLLNPTDYISIKILVSDYQGQMQIYSRISGIKEIILYLESSWLSAGLLISGLTLIILSALFLYLSFETKYLNSKDILFILFYMGSTLCYTGALLDKRWRNRFINFIIRLLDRIR